MSPTALDEAVKTVRQRIDHQIDQYLKIKDLFFDLGINVGTLNTAFENTFHISIYRYHIVKKMEYAKSLLGKGFQVKEVAILLGYSTTGSFSRAFKSVYYHPPQFYKLQ
jgi:AraC-like DNA-binding protein